MPPNVSLCSFHFIFFYLINKFQHFPQNVWWWHCSKEEQTLSFARQSPTIVASKDVIRPQTLPAKSDMQRGLACTIQIEEFGFYSLENGKSLQDWYNMPHAISLEDKFVS